MSPRTKTQIAQLRAERRAQILQVAVRVFSRKGFYAANVSDVAVEARLSQGTVYHYFKSKEDLFMAVFQAWETENLNREVHALMDNSVSAANRLRLLAKAVGERMVRSEKFLTASVEFWSHIHRNTAIQEGFRRIFTELRSIVSALIRDGVTQGEFESIDPNTTASLLIAVYDGLVLQWLADPNSVDWQTESATLTELVLHGLLKTPGKSENSKGGRS